MTVYMAVTTDEYELPLAVTRTLQEMAVKFNTSTCVVSQSITKNMSGKIRGAKFIKVEIDM